MRYKIIVLGLFWAVLSQAEVKDSVGVTDIGGKKYILHQISSGETLFSVARKYKLTIQDLKQTNPELANGLKSNQVIKIPMPEVEKSQVALPQNDSYVLHKVESGQTLYAISKKYNVSVEKIKKWNNLESNELKLGSYIIVGEKNTIVAEPKEEKTPVNETSNTAVGASNNQEINAAKKESKKTVDGHFIEKGTVSVFEIKDGELYFFAMHKTAPIGTIIKIMYQNEESIFVRVVEKLPSNDANVVKLSKMAFNKLGLSNSSLVSLEYVID